MRGEDHVVEAAEHRLERVALRLRLDREHVERGAGDVAGLDVLAQRDVVDDHAAGGVDEQRARLHPRELLGAEEPGVARAGRRRAARRRRPRRAARRGSASGGRCRARAGRRCRRRSPAGRAPRRGWRAGCRCCRSRRCRASGRGSRGCPWPTCPRRPRASCCGLLRQPAGQRDDLADHQLDDAAGVGVRRVEDRDAALGGRRPGRPGWCRCRSSRSRPGRSAASSTRGVRWVLERIPSSWTPRASASTSSSSEREPARSSTSWPRASSVSTATGWMFSRSRTFTRSRVGAARGRARFRDEPWTAAATLLDR